MGGREEYQTTFNLIRPQVLERDKNRCVKCGLALDLEVHHIDGYTHNEMGDLVTLCSFCHGIAPMGKELFNQWMLIGEDGIDVIRRRLAKNGLKGIKREQVIIFCSTIVELNFDTVKAKMKSGREISRSHNGRCEGRKPYGRDLKRPDEAYVLEKMKGLFFDGKNSEQIAQRLNYENIPTRYGKKWIAPSVCKIMRKEGFVKPKRKISA
jgi:hypothetical protein